MEVPEGVYVVAPEGVTGGGGGDVCTWVAATGRTVTPRTVTVLRVVVGAIVNP